jgi:hypothetical protein
MAEPNSEAATLILMGDWRGSSGADAETLRQRDCRSSSTAGEPIDDSGEHAARDLHAHVDYAC